MNKKLVVIILLALVSVCLIILYKFIQKYNIRLANNNTQTSQETTKLDFFNFKIPQSARFYFNITLVTSRLEIDPISSEKELFFLQINKTGKGYYLLTNTFNILFSMDDREINYYLLKGKITNRNNFVFKLICWFYNNSGSIFSKSYIYGGSGGWQFNVPNFSVLVKYVRLPKLILNIVKDLNESLKKVVEKYENDLKYLKINKKYTKNTRIYEIKVTKDEIISNEGIAKLTHLLAKRILSLYVLNNPDQILSIEKLYVKFIIKNNELKELYLNCTVKLKRSETGDINILAINKTFSLDLKISPAPSFVVENIIKNKKYSEVL